MKLQFFKNSRKYTAKISKNNLSIFNVFNKTEKTYINNFYTNSKTKNFVTFEFKEIFFLHQIIAFSSYNQLRVTHFNYFEKSKSINYTIINYNFNNEINILKKIINDTILKKLYFKTLKKRVAGYTITSFSTNILIVNNFHFKKINSDWYSNLQNKNYAYIFNKNVTNFVRMFPELTNYFSISKKTKPFYANHYIGIHARESAYSFRQIKKEFKKKLNFVSVDKKVKESFSFSRKAFFLLSFNKPKKNYYIHTKFKKKINLIWIENKNSIVKCKKLYRKIDQANKNEFISKSVFKKKLIFFQASKPYYDKATDSNRTITNRFKIKRRSQLISFLTGFSISFFRINSLAHTRFAFDSNIKKVFYSEKISKRFKIAIKNSVIKKKKSYKKKTKNSRHFLIKIKKERQFRYKYVGIYIHDLIRISFRALYSKYAQLLINFFAFSLSKLPRNRKETKFIRFLIKLVKVFSTQRQEIIGVRLRFQGRINRWRRTKHIVGQKGILPLHSYSTHLSYGIAQAITRKGAFGRRLWIAYDTIFFKVYKKTLFSFFNAFKKYL